MNSFIKFLKDAYLIFIRYVSHNFYAKLTKLHIFDSSHDSNALQSFTASVSVITVSW